MLSQLNVRCKYCWPHTSWGCVWWRARSETRVLLTGVQSTIICCAISYPPVKLSLWEAWLSLSLCLMQWGIPHQLPTSVTGSVSAYFLGVLTLLALKGADYQWLQSQGHPLLLQSFLTPWLPSHCKWCHLCLLVLQDAPGGLVPKAPSLEGYQRDSH